MAGGGVRLTHNRTVGWTGTSAAASAGKQALLSCYTVAAVRSSTPRSLSAACAAARRAIGTRYGEQET